MKNTYEIISSTELKEVEEKINECLAMETHEIFFIGGVTNQGGVYCQAILKIPKEKLPVDVPVEAVPYNTAE